MRFWQPNTARETRDGRWADGSALTKSWALGKKEAEAVMGQIPNAATPGIQVNV